LFVEVSEAEGGKAGKNHSEPTDANFRTLDQSRMGITM
jgi:hypothetical protein